MENRIDRRTFLRFAVVAAATAATEGIRSRFLGEPVKAAESLSGPEIHERITDRDFLLQEREPRALSTRQRDPTEYSTEYMTSALMNNTCGQAVIASVLKIYSFCESGAVPDITIQTILNDLESKSYLGASQQRSFFEDGMRMRLSGVKAALDFYAASYPIQTTAFSEIPISGYSEDRTVNSVRLIEAKISHLITEAQDIFAKGGIVVFFSTTYRGHFFLASNVYRDENNDFRAFVIDSFGPSESRDGLVQDVSLASFVGYYEGEPGSLLSAFGVYPTYT